MTCLLTMRQENRYIGGHYLLSFTPRTSTYRYNAVIFTEAFTICALNLLCMRCLLWILRLGHVQHLSLSCCMQYRVILDIVICSQRVVIWTLSQYEYILSWYMHSHYKDKTVLRPSYLYKGNPYTDKTFYIETPRNKDVHWRSPYF